MSLFVTSFPKYRNSYFSVRWNFYAHRLVGKVRCAASNTNHFWIMLLCVRYTIIICRISFCIVFFETKSRAAFQRQEAHIFLLIAALTYLTYPPFVASSYVFIYTAFNPSKKVMYWIVTALRQMKVAEEKHTYAWHIDNWMDRMRIFFQRQFSWRFPSSYMTPGIAVPLCR